MWYQLEEWSGILHKKWLSSRYVSIGFRKVVIDLLTLPAGVAFRDVRSEALYPSIGMKKSGEHVKTNFGQFPFVFDIDRFVAVGRFLQNSI